MRKFSKKKNFLQERGFNMFSIIVATILIMTGVVLTSTLITTEEKTSRQIYNMLNNYQLSDAANIARADALQTFNYQFREKLEDYLTFTQKELNDEPGFTLFVIKQPNQKFTFNDMKTTFEDVILLTGNNKTKKFTAAINFVAENTIDQFHEGTYGRFTVSLSDSTVEAKRALGDAALAAVINNQKDFLEVVGCDDSECPVGSFYFNIPLNTLTDQQYESLPRIIVKDVITKEEIKMAILPRTNLKVYIPLRFFKALTQAGKAAEAMARAHNELSQYRLGFCGACQPNSTPFGKLNTWELPCDGSLKADLESEVLGITQYTSGNQSAGSEGLWAYGAVKTCEELLNADAFTTDDLKFVVNNAGLAPDNVQRRKAIANCGLNKLVIGVGQVPTYTVDGTGVVGSKLRCGQITSTNADLVMKETNLTYIVRGTYEDKKSNIFVIRIEDTGFERVFSDDKYQNLGKCTSGTTECK